MSTPTGLEVAGFLGRGDDLDLVSLAFEHLPLVTTFARAYTRGKGFDATGEPNAELAAVIVTATARLVTNPTADRREQLGEYGRTPHEAGWSLPELDVLHRYRKRTA